MGIILIIAIPNVIESINEGKKDNFGSEASTILSTAKAQYNLDKGRDTVQYDIVGDERISTYCHSWGEDTECKNEFNANNDNGTRIKVKVNIDGLVTYAYITDGRFYYACYSLNTCKKYNKKRVLDTTKEGENVPSLDTDYLVDE